MLTIALELALDNPVYEELACKFFVHFIYIAAAMDRIGNNADELWDEEDGFFYDVLRLPKGDAVRLKVRSMVGLVPLMASAIFEDEVSRQVGMSTGWTTSRRNRRPDCSAATPTGAGRSGCR
jgi:hypothetical protein